MNSRYLRLGIAAFAVSLGITACGDDVLVSEEHFTTVNSLNDEDCNDQTEGSMAFVKSSTTMYVCSDGEWIAMSDEEAVKYRCSSKELADKSGFAIICDGDTIGVINNGRDGADGKDGVNGKDGANGENGTNGTNGTNGKDGNSGTNGSNGVSADTAAINKAVKDAISSLSSAVSKVRSPRKQPPPRPRLTITSSPASERVTRSSITVLRSQEKPDAARWARMRSTVTG